MHRAGISRAEPARASQVHGALSELRAMGFEVEPFGPTTLLLKGAPAVFGPEGGAKLLGDMIESMGDAGFRGGGEAAFDSWLKQLACHGSVRVGRVLELPEIHSLLAELRSHRVQNQLPARTPGAYPVRTRADRANVPSMSFSVAEFSASMRPARIAVGFIVGPTGAGKSALAMEVAERSNCEIVNADSRQFYRGMDLGTAKPSAADLSRVPHHLIDVRDPDESLDVAEFAQLARASIEDIAARGRNPLVVGGSGLYLRVIRGGIFRGPAASMDIRDRLAKVAAEQGVAHLHQRLREIESRGGQSNRRQRPVPNRARAGVFELTGEQFPRISGGIALPTSATTL